MPSAILTPAPAPTVLDPEAARQGRIQAILGALVDPELSAAPGTPPAPGAGAQPAPKPLAPVIPINTRFALSGTPGPASARGNAQFATQPAGPVDDAETGAVTPGPPSTDTRFGGFPKGTPGLPSFGGAPGPAWDYKGGSPEATHSNLYMPLGESDYLSEHPAAAQKPMTYTGPSLWRRLLFGLAAGAAGIRDPAVGAGLVNRYNQAIEQREQQAVAYNRALPALNQAAKDRAYQTYLRGMTARADAANVQSEIQSRSDAAKDAQLRLTLEQMEDQLRLRGEPKMFTVPGSNAPVVGYLTPQGVVDGAGNPLQGAVPYAKATPKSPVAGLLHGQRAFGVWDGTQWVGTEGTLKGKPLLGFEPAPTYAQTGYYDLTVGFDPKTGSLGSGKFDRRTGNFTLANGDSGIPLPQEAVKQISDNLDAARQADTKLRVMTDNEGPALQGDQQAMLSLVANHIGMTLGQQKGARINQAVWDEAVKSTPWLAGAEARFGKGGYLSGVVLTPEQIRQMVGLAQERDYRVWQQAQQTAQTYSVPLKIPAWAGSGGPLPPPGVPPGSKLMVLKGFHRWVKPGSVDAAKKAGAEEVSGGQ